MNFICNGSSAFTCLTLVEYVEPQDIKC